MLNDRDLASLAAILCLLGGGLPTASHGAITTNNPPVAQPFAPTPTGASPTHSVVIQMRPHESLAVALTRAGVCAGDVVQASAALADDFDTLNPHPGLTLHLGLAPAGLPSGKLRLTSIELAPRDDERLGLVREADGGLHLRRVQNPVFLAPMLTRGIVRGSLYLSIVEAGVSPDQAAKIVRLFGRHLDLVRDIETGDHFCLVFEQHRRASDGQALDAGELLYAEIVTPSGRARLYRYQPTGARQPEWVDGDFGPKARGLLRTPVDGARLTSGFGMRMHPILGFTRMHQGVDFGASVGTPVMSAGDGVVEEARWDGDYGRWLKIRHSPGLETGYAHLSAWASGVGPGKLVHQGEIVAYVGATGLVTGPHLHYEVFVDGQRIDPRMAPGQNMPGGAPPNVDPEFRARKADVDAEVASIAAACAVPSLFPAGQAPHCVG